MKKQFKTIEHEAIREILLKHDHRVIFEKTNVVPDESAMRAELEKSFGLETVSRKSVLGLDIYQYSSYGEFEQMLIPFLFKTMLNTTIDLCIDNHPFIFQDYTRERIEKNFISTGDGGFLIFDTPLHSLLFACNYAVVLRIYNAFHFYPRLRKIIGGIKLESDNRYYK